MTAPKDQQQEPDELDLDAETVSDLELGERDADAVKGGSAGTCAPTVVGCQVQRPSAGCQFKGP